MRILVTGRAGFIGSHFGLVQPLDEKAATKPRVLVDLKS
jgi:nucleoside-diphosphate-sugar epimerase